MSMKRRSYSFGMRRANGGFSLIEVLIALVVLAVGLLGVAMMQVMSLRFTQSANERTVATNLAYELIDMMRSNRLLASQYTAIAYDSFDSVTTAGGCDRETAADAADPASNMARWRCEVRVALPNGAAVVRLPGDGVVQVDMRWTDAHWKQDSDPGDGTDEQQVVFTVESRL